jgi:uncharacterized protein (DUF433 family)
MKAILHKNELGCGIYTAGDISRILKINPAKVRHYIDQFWDERIGKKLFSDTYTWNIDNRIKAVNFYVLIEFYTFFKLKELGVKTNKILKAREHIAKEFHIEYPFASMKVLSDGKRIWYDFQDDIINADGSNQTNFKNIIECFAKRIDFHENLMAERYWPAGRDSHIIIDPHHQFGQPTINGTNINAEVIYSMYKSGEQVESIGILYDLAKSEVQDAINFYQKAA